MNASKRFFLFIVVNLKKFMKFIYLTQLEMKIN